MILTLYRVLYIMWQFHNATFELLLRSKWLTWTLKWKVRFFKCTFLLEWWFQSRLFLWFQMVAQVTDFNHLFRILNPCIHHFKETLSLFSVVKDMTSEFLKNNKQWSKHLVFANSIIFKCLVCPPPPLSVSKGNQWHITGHAWKPIQTLQQERTNTF